MSIALYVRAINVWTEKENNYESSINLVLIKSLSEFLEVVPVVFVEHSPAEFIRKTRVCGSHGYNLGASFLIVPGWGARQSNHAFDTW